MLLALTAFSEMVKEEKQKAKVLSLAQTTTPCRKICLGLPGLNNLNIEKEKANLNNFPPILLHMFPALLT